MREMDLYDYNVIMVALFIYVGAHHPKVGVVLTCIALMYRQKAKVERSSSLLIQEVR